MKSKWIITEEDFSSKIDLDMVDSKEIIDKAKYGFRGTNKAFYDFQLNQSLNKFGKKGFYSAMGFYSDDTRKTSFTLSPLHAIFYATSKDSRKYGFNDFCPIILLIDLEKYKDNIIPGLEFGGLIPGWEFEIQSPIDTKDTQILNKNHINNIESYLTKFNGFIIDQPNNVTNEEELMIIKKSLSNFILNF